MAQYSSWVHGVAAQQEADVKQNESVAASSILEFNSTEPTASNPGVLHCSKRFQGKSGGAQRFYFAIPTPNIVLGARANIFRVFLMYDFDPGASIDKALVFDGPNQLIETGVSRVVDGPGFDGVPDPRMIWKKGSTCNSEADISIIKLRSKVDARRPMRRNLQAASRATWAEPPTP